MYGRLLHGIGTAGVLLRLLRHVSLRVECVVGHHDGGGGGMSGGGCQEGVCTEREADNKQGSRKGWNEEECFTG